MIAEAGVDAIGLNFYPPSPRKVSADLAAEISALVAATTPSIQRVGLFVDAEPASIREVLQTCALDMLQFHGDEPPDYCEQFGLPYIKVLRMRPGTDVRGAAQRYSGAWGLLLDAFVEGLPGGTGQRIDLGQWPFELAESTRLVLAGGLNPDNVAAAVRAVAPFGVDAASGVEGSEKGRKDLSAVNKFLTEVRNVRTYEDE